MPEEVQTPEEKHHKVFWEPKKGHSFSNLSRMELLALRAGLILAAKDAPMAAGILEEAERILLAQHVELDRL